MGDVGVVTLMYCCFLEGGVKVGLMGGRWLYGREDGLMEKSHGRKGKRGEWKIRKKFCGKKVNEMEEEKEEGWKRRERGERGKEGWKKERKR